ncbi:MAG TPA: DNA translocase FtsK [Firmicutes bacterium]|nr:DNA translocase FtsK [Bacillota bacterium]
MNKRKIFDIEKIGFGDEHIYIKKEIAKPMEEITKTPEPLVQQNGAKLNVAKTELTKPQVNLEEKDFSNQDRISLEEIKKPKIKKVTSRFKPNDFVSPIYGKMEDQSVLSKLVQGTLTSATDLFFEERHEDSKLLQEGAKDEYVSFNESSSKEEELFVNDDFNEEVANAQFKEFNVQNENQLIIDQTVKGSPFVFSPHEKLVKTTDIIEVEEVEDHEFELEVESRDSDFYNEVIAEDASLPTSQPYYYEMPSLDLLAKPEREELNDEDWVIEKMDTLDQTFANFSVGVNLTGDYTQGPTVTQIEIQPEPGTKVSKILNLENDLKLSLAVEYLRIEAPIPGKSSIGIEIPNRKRKKVVLREILSQPKFMLHESPLFIALGQDICGDPVYTNILTMPHGLIAGQTGSGKSVCINTLLLSILYKASPEDVRIMLVDPKKVELAPYNEIPHLVTPVISDEKKAAIGLKWAVEEMERRYELFAQNGVRDIKSFNDRRLEFEMDYEKLPYILIIIDELADLMMVSAQEVEDSIMRITQKARAAGIHMIVATQRPTVDVVTGTIKSNIPSRIAFAVAQGNDSKVILDKTGAESLLGAGDMLISENGVSKLRRVQGAYVSANEIDQVVAHVKKQAKPKYLISETVFERGSSKVMSDSDPLIDEITEFLIDQGAASASLVQRRFSIGFNRAARIIDTLEMRGFVSKSNGTSSKPRDVLITRSEFEAYKKDATRI